MLTEQNCFWVAVLSHKYIHGKPFLEDEYKTTASFSWRSILKDTSALRYRFKWSIGDGNTSLWYGNWLGDGNLCNRVDFVHISDTDLRVADIWRDGRWCLDILSTDLPQDIRNSILNREEPTFTEDDGWIWQHKVDGNFTTSSAYSWLVCNRRLVVSDPKWRWLWKLKCPEKIKLLLWLYFHSVLPTGLLRFQRGLFPLATCSRCSAPVENIEHCLHDCP